MSKNDEKIIALKKTIEKRKEELGKKETFAPITSCSLDVEGTRYNLHAINDMNTLSFIMCKLHALEMAAADLEIDASALALSGFSVSDWMHDLKAKAALVNRQAKESELKAFEKKLDALLSTDKKTELEIDSIAALLG